MPETQPQFTNEHQNFRKFQNKMPQYFPRRKDLERPISTARARIAENLRYRRQVTERRPDERSSLADYIAYFDSNWQKEGLPHDWWNLIGKKSEIGFSMRTQMALLKDPNDTKAVAEWTQETKQDLFGFKLEVLSNHLVYPCKYERSSTDPTRLESRDYSNKDITETVSDKERNGSVKESMKAMKDYFLSENTPDGSIAVMASPLGNSGLKTDKGQNIDYPDSYFFIMQKEGDTVVNYTVKTDFSTEESREVIYQLTGIKLTPAAPLEDYTRTIATINPGQDDRIRSVSDVVRILQTVRPSHAFKDDQKNSPIGWNEVYRDIALGDNLYKFNNKTMEVIKKFEAYCLRGRHTKLDFQKAIAGSILLMSALFIAEEGQNTVTQIPMTQNEWSSVPVDLATQYLPGFIGQSYGSVLERVSERPGCAGGGKKVTVETVGGVRMGQVNRANNEVLGQCQKIRCGNCSWEANDDEAEKITKGTLTKCPDCGWKP